MERIIETLRRKNRALLELQTGILFLGVICQLVGAFLVRDQEFYARSLWIGVLLALAGSIHMYRTLDHALERGAAAGRIVTGSYLVRYGVLALVAVGGGYLGVCNPLVTFLGCMTMKGAAYLQPFAHRLTNRIFHESDPIPEPLVEELPASESEGTPQPEAQNE